MIFGKHINKYYLKYSGWLILGIITLAVIDYVQLIIPNLYQMVINGMNEGFVVINGQSYTFDMDFLLDKVCIPLILIAVSMVFGRFLWRICFFGTAIKVDEKLRNEMFSHAKDLSTQYYQVNKVGNLMSLFTNDLDTVEECFGDGMLMLCDAAILGTMSLVKMWNMDPILSLLALIPMIFLLGASAVVGKYMMKKWDIRQEAFSKMSDFAQESFSGIAVIKAFVKEAAELWAFKKLNRENEEANIEFTRFSVLLKILVTLFVESVICVILGYGGYLVHKGSFNAGQLVEFIGYFTSIVWPIMAISELIDMTSRGKASLKRISELLDAKQDVFDKPDVLPCENVKGDIEFKNLSFTYPNAKSPSLKNINLKINAGERVGLVGKTGSGKTTLVDLLLRIYNVENGTLFIDGYDVNAIKIRDVRAACAYVPQDNFLFSDTIENNISFATDKKDSSSVQHAAILADVDGNINEFSLKYQTVLGERGVTVSGGQKQRISIARALLKDAPILILDDSVSAVDTKTEKAILSNLEATRKNKTTILIAHRISTVEKMDKIIFIDNGRIVAIGPHSKLYEECGEYRKMVELQKLDDEGGSQNV